MRLCVLSDEVRRHAGQFDTSNLPTFRRLQSAWAGVERLPDLQSATCLRDEDGNMTLARLPHAPIKAQRFFAAALAQQEHKASLFIPVGAERHQFEGVAQARGTSAYGGKGIMHFPVGKGSDKFLEPFAAKIMFAIKFLPTVGHLVELPPGFDTVHDLLAHGRGGSHATHRAVGVEFAAMLRAMGKTVVPEPRGFSMEDNKRPDFAAADAGGNIKVYDHSVVLNLAKSYVRAAARVPGHAADLRENEKHVKYDIALATALGPGNLIVPFAIEETGGWGTEFATEFKEWIAQLREEEREAGGEGWQATMTMLHWQQRVARALYSSLARRVVARARSVQPRHQQDAPLPGVQ